MKKIEVQFYHAYWCGSCEKMKPIIKDLAEDTALQKLSFIDVDCETDRGVDMSTKYSVRNLPTILVVANGNVLERISGSRTKNELKDLLIKYAK